MDGNVIRLVLEEATALTASLPESVREVAFSKAFDVLLDEHGVATRGSPRERGRSQSRPSRGIRSSPPRVHGVGPK